MSRPQFVVSIALTEDGSSPEAAAREFLADLRSGDPFILTVTAADGTVHLVDMDTLTTVDSADSASVR